MSPPVMRARRDLDESSYLGPVLRSMGRVSKTQDRWESGNAAMSSTKAKTMLPQRRELKQLFPNVGKTRTPRALTDLRKKKIHAFIKRNSANPDEYDFGDIGTKVWISALIKHLNEPRNHAVNPADVCHWLKTSNGFFQKEHRRAAALKSRMLLRAVGDKDSDSPQPSSSPSVSISSSTTIPTDSGVGDDSGGGGTNNVDTESDNPVVPATVGDLNVEMGTDAPPVTAAVADFQDFSQGDKMYWLGEDGVWNVVDQEVVLANDEGGLTLKEVKQEPVDYSVEPGTSTPSETQRTLEGSTKQIMEEIQSDLLQEIQTELLQEIQTKPLDEIQTKSLEEIKTISLEEIKTESLQDIKEEEVNVDPYFEAFQTGQVEDLTSLSKSKEELEENPNLTALVPVPMNMYPNYDPTYFDSYHGGDLLPDGYVTDIVPYQDATYSAGVTSTANNEEPFSNQPTSSKGYIVRSDLDNIPADAKGLIENIESFGDAKSVLLKLSDTNAFDPDVENMQLFTTILTKLVNRAKKSGTFVDADIKTLSFSAKIMATTLGRMS